MREAGYTPRRGLERRIIVITGGCSGIGRQLAEDYLAAGATVVLVSDRADRLATAVTELRLKYPTVESFNCDVADSPAVAAMCQYVLRTHGCPHILVNSAGFATYRTIEESSLQELERLVDVNFLGAVRCSKGFMPSMIGGRAGTIVNIASLAGRLVMTPNGTYSAAKHALVAWSIAMRWELARFGINVNVICPGRVETAFFDHETFAMRAPRAEARFTVPVHSVSQQTIRAIKRNRGITYIPAILGPAIWMVNAFQPISGILYRRLMLSRIESVYQRGR